MGTEDHWVTRENGFSPESSMLEQAGGNADMWSHMEALMGVRAGSSHQHPVQIFAWAFKHSLPPPISSATLLSMMLKAMLLSWPKSGAVLT